MLRCLEALFQRLAGVSQVTPGYAGGDTNNPTYREVCAGNTGHAEVIQITFNPGTISVSDLLEFFFEAHDPTTLNRQGNDVGTQYRSTIMPYSPEQSNLARTALDQAAGSFEEPIVTTIEPLETFTQRKPIITIITTSTNPRPTAPLSSPQNSTNCATD